MKILTKMTMPNTISINKMWKVKKNVQDQEIHVTERNGRKSENWSSSTIKVIEDCFYIRKFILTDKELYEGILSLPPLCFHILCKKVFFIVPDFFL